MKELNFVCLWSMWLHSVIPCHFCLIWSAVDLPCYGWVDFHCLFQPLIWFTFTKWVKGMKSKDRFMVNVAECCFGSCLCLCSWYSFAFCKPALKGPLWILVHLSTGLYSYSHGPGMVCRYQGDNLLGCLRLHAMSTVCWVWKWSWAALWPAIADVGEEPWLGLVRKEGSVCSLKSPFFIFLLLHQILLHLCGVRSMPQKPWAQEEWVLGAPSSCAASQPILGSGMAEGKNHKTEQESWEIFPSPAWVGGSEHQSSAFAKTYWLFSTVQYLSLPTNSIFYL